MIRALRRRHRWLVALVGFVTCALLALALSARPDRPFQDHLDELTATKAR